jgi:hypothetical protein
MENEELRMDGEFVRITIYITFETSFYLKSDL